MSHIILIIGWLCSCPDQGIWGHYDMSLMILSWYSITLHLSHADIHCPPYPYPPPPHMPLWTPLAPLKDLPPLDPTTFLTPAPQIPLHLHEKVYDHTHCYVLSHNVLTPRDIRLHLLQSCVPHCLHWRGVTPAPIGSSPRLLPYQSAFHPVTKDPHNPTNARGDHPCLQAEKYITWATA